MVLCPVAERRIADRCFVFTWSASGPPLPPYKTAGTVPATRRRRAAFLPLVSRGAASTMICSINPSPFLERISFENSQNNSWRQQRRPQSTSFSLRKLQIPQAEACATQSSEKQFADRGLLVNRMNAAGEQFGDAQNLDP